MLYYRGCTAREKDQNIDYSTRYLFELADLDYHIF